VPGHPLSASTFAHARVRGAVARARIQPADRDDLAQDLYLRLVRAGRRFDPRVGPAEAFVTAVVARGVVDARRRRGTRKARAGPQASGRDGLGPDAADPRDPRDPIARLHLALDVAAVLAGLPAALRALAADLSQGTLAAAARSRGVPRAALARDVRALRAAFERHKIHNS
jgi:DNA-directed RNA polymerase specialized sigma24 family protein